MKDNVENILAYWNSIVVHPITYRNYFEVEIEGNKLYLIRDGERLRTYGYTIGKANQEQIEEKLYENLYYDLVSGAMSIFSRI